jgi:hypothetical protein
MGFQLPPLPNFQTNIPQMPSPVDQMARVASLKNMLSENTLRQQLAPLNIQEAQERAKQSSIQTQKEQLALDSQKKLQDAIASGAFNKFAGTEAPDGSGFDAAGAYQELVSKHGVLPEQAGAAVESLQKIGQSMAEQRKTNAQAAEANATVRGKTLDALAAKLGSIGDMPANKAIDALDAFHESLVKNPKAYPGLTQDELSHLYASDLTLLPAMVQYMGIEGKLADYHKSKAEAANATGKTDPNSPLYDPSAAYLAKRAAAGDPDAKAILAQQANQAGAKAGAEAAAKFPYELQLKQQELAQNPIFAVNPKTGQRELSTVADAKANGFTNPVKVSQPQVENETTLNAQLNDLQLNTSRYKAALNAMGPLSKSDVANMTRVLSDKSINSFLTNELTLGVALDQVSQGEKASAWNALSPDKQAALIGSLRMKNSALLFQKVSTGMGRASKEAMEIEISNMPSPIEGATVGNQKLQSFQENIDQMASRSVKLPWMDQPQDVRTRIERQATDQYNKTQAGKQQGQYRATNPVTLGQNIQIRNTPGLSRVKKVYSDGSFDADQKP